MRPSRLRPPLVPASSGSGPPVPAKSQERLLPNSAFARNFNNYSLDDVKSAASVHEMSAPPSPERDALRNMEIENEGPEVYRTYKRRWFGLLQLVLLNLVVSWNWLAFAAISSTSARYFNVSDNAINWLSTGFLFAFVAASPAAIFILNKGPKPAILFAAILILAGSWIRYVGARTQQYVVVITGQILIGLGQPFVLAAPTRFSDMWFSEKGRISATALASLANPLGGALGQLLSPELAGTAEKVPNMVLYLAIISSIAAVPSFFIPREPPTPPSASSSLPKTPLSKTFSELYNNTSFYLILIPFSVYVGFFNALSSLLNQILGPYGFTETQAGIAGGILIVVGLVAGAAVSPITDRTHAYTMTMKVLTPIVGISYLAFIFAPPTRLVYAPYIILALLGASSFALVPIALEYLAEVTYPVSPEVSSVVCWAGGQLLGAVFLIIMGLLKDDEGTEMKNYPPGNMQRALIFEGCIACLVAVLPMFLGARWLGLDGEARRRFAVDEGEGEPRLGARRTPASSRA